MVIPLDGWSKSIPGSETGHVAPESAHIEGDRLVWSPGTAKAPSAKVSTLQAFARLTTPSQVEKFALRHGVLRLCGHGLPSSHNPPTGSESGCRPEREGKFLVESIGDWLTFAEQLRAIQSITLDLKNGKRGAWSDWESLGRQGADPRQIGGSDEDRKLVLTEERVLVASKVTGWLRLGDVRPVLSWAPEGVVQRWSGVGLFGELAVLLAANLGGRWMVRCAGPCTNLVEARGGGQRSWCPECVKSGERQKRSKEDERGRRRAGIPANPNRGRKDVPRPSVTPALYPGSHAGPLRRELLPHL